MVLFHLACPSAIKLTAEEHLVIFPQHDIPQHDNISAFIGKGARSGPLLDIPFNLKLIKGNFIIKGGFYFFT